MRMLLLSKAMVVGTYQRKAEELAALPGVELTVAVPPAWHEPRVGTLTLERRHIEGYRLVVLPIWFNGHFHIHLYPGIQRLVRSLKPDILHIDEESFNLATFQAMRAGVATGARCCFYNYANVARRYPPPWGWFEAYNFRHAAAAMVANHEAAEIIRAHGYAGPIHEVWQFGIDPELFRPEPRPADGIFRIGYIGRLVPEKGVEELVRAVAQLPPTAALTIIGSGSEEAALRAVATQLNVGDRVIFKGQIPSGDVPAEMRQLDVLVLPSHTTPRWKEQFGRILIEAMASGVPPVGSDSGEIPHVIGDGGLVFREGEVDDLAAKLRLLMDHPDTRALLAQRGRQRAIDRYTHRAVAQHSLEVYRQMLESPPATR